MSIQNAQSAEQSLSESDLTDLDSSDSGSLAVFDIGRTKCIPTTSTTSICDEEPASTISEPVDTAPSPLSLFSNSQSSRSYMTRKKRRIGPASSREDPDDNTRPTFSSKAASPSSVIDLTSPLSSQEPSTSQAPHLDYSSIYVTDALVWIRINLSRMCVPVSPGTCTKCLWWPAKITSSTSDITPSHVLPFGCPSYTSVRSEIPIISAVNDLRPMRTSKLRKSLWFTEKTFIVGDGQPSNTSKPLKKSEQQKLTCAWKAAVKEMLAAEDGYDNSSSDSMNLPDASLAFASPKAANRKLKTMSESNNQRLARKKRKHQSDSDGDSISDITDDDELRTWTPPEADPDLDIPGELVLADHRRRKIYWPARIIAYIPPAHKRDRPRYRVEYLDEDQANIFRNEFFTSIEDGFATCHLGQHAASAPVPVYDSPDTARTHESPLTHKMPGDFNSFSLYDQLAHVKPVLTAILYGKYAPARDNHRRWMRGGKSRADVIRESANIRGRIHERQLVDLKNLILEWALGCKTDFGNGDDDDNDDFLQECVGEVRGRAHKGRDDSKTAPLGVHEMDLSHRASKEAHAAESGMDVNTLTQISCSRGVPQHGSVEYEALTSSDKPKYCMDILLPEAVIQIHLWRLSERDTLDLLDDEEEKRLHEIGLKHATWVDWVSTVMLLRERAAFTYNRKQPKQPEYNKTGVWTRSRPLKA